MKIHPFFAIVFFYVFFVVVVKISNNLNILSYSLPCCVCWWRWWWWDKNKTADFSVELVYSGFTKCTVHRNWSVTFSVYCFYITPTTTCCVSLVKLMTTSLVLCCLCACALVCVQRRYIRRLLNCVCSEYHTFVYKQKKKCSFRHSWLRN